MRSQRGERWVSANDFFVGLFTTLLEVDELLLEIALPALPPRTGWALEEVARRPHDFALVGVAAVVTLDQSDLCQVARIVFLSVGDGPVVARQGAEELVGQVVTPESIRAAAETASRVDLDPSSDIHASADFRRHLSSVLARRALQRAYERASTNGRLEN